MLFLFSLLLYNVFSIPWKEQLINSLPYYQIKLLQYKKIGSYFFDAKLGSPSQSVFQYIDLLREYNSINVYSFKPNESSTIKFLNRQDNSSLYEDTFTFGSHEDNPIEQLSLKRIPFYVFDDNKHDRPILSLSLNSHKFSIMNYLKKKNIINRRVFTFFNDLDNDDHFYGYIILGDFFNNEIIKSHYHKSQCVVRRAQWGCELLKVNFQIDNVKYQYRNHFPLTFQTESNKIFCPSHFFNFISSILLSGNYQCEIRNYTSSQVIACNDCKITIKLLHFSFLFDNNVRYSLPELFERDFGYCDLIIQNSFTHSNEWIVGTSFLEQYLTSFDMDSKTISIYSEFPFEVISLSKIRVVMLAQISVDIIASFYIVIIMFNIK